MFLDGEVVFVAKRGAVLTGLMDLMHVVECSDWIETWEQVDEHMGSYGWFWRQMGRWATPLM